MKLLLERWRLYVEKQERTPRKYYAFDWDDNIVFMPTKIILLDKEDVEVGMSTRDFADYREMIGVEEFEYEGRTIVGFAENAFKFFRHPGGDPQFLVDAETATPGPSWNDFAGAINEGSIFAIITARGHHPETIKSAVRNYINSEYEGINKQSVIESLRSYKSTPAFSTEGDDDFIIEEYLKLCRFYPVSFKAAAEANPEQAKGEKLSEFIEHVKSLNKGKPFEIGFSDDDPGNIEVIKKLKKDQGLSNLIIKYTGG